MIDLSRTAWDSFIRCKRCFYLERKLKIKPIGIPGYPINSRVDFLLLSNKILEKNTSL